MKRDNNQQIICYEDLFTYSCNDYGVLDVTSGIFTAPFSGCFAFHLTLQFGSGFNNAAIVAGRTCSDNNCQHVFRQLGAVCYYVDETDYNYMEAKSTVFTFAHLNSGEDVCVVLDGSIVNNEPDASLPASTFTCVSISIDS